MRDIAGRLDALSDNIASIYASKADGSTEEWRAAMLAETWYSADEAVAAGLADVVESGVEPDEALNRFDLSAFKHAGRNEAPAPLIVESAEVARADYERRLNLRRKPRRG